MAFRMINAADFACLMLLSSVESFGPLLRGSWLFLSRYDLARYFLLRLDASIAASCLSADALVLCVPKTFLPELSVTTNLLPRFLIAMAPPFVRLYHIIHNTNKSRNVGASGLIRVSIHCSSE